MFNQNLISRRIKSKFQTVFGKPVYSNRTMSSTPQLGDPNRPLRVAHITDLHWLSDQYPSFFEMLGKRIIGYVIRCHENYFFDLYYIQCMYCDKYPHIFIFPSIVW